MRRGLLGEQLAVALIKDRWRRARITHVSLESPFSPYDFRVLTRKGKTRFVEVKATTRVEPSVLISAAEVRFRQEHRKRHLILVVQLSPGGAAPIMKHWWFERGVDLDLAPTHYRLAVPGEDSHA